MTSTKDPGDLSLIRGCEVASGVRTTVSSSYVEDRETQEECSGSSHGLWAGAPGQTWCSQALARLWALPNSGIQGSRTKSGNCKDMAVVRVGGSLLVRLSSQ